MVAWYWLVISNTIVALAFWYSGLRFAERFAEREKAEDATEKLSGITPSGVSWFTQVPGFQARHSKRLWRNHFGKTK